MAKIQRNEPEGPKRPHHPSSSNRGVALSDAIVNESEKVTHASNPCFVMLRITFKQPEKKNPLVRHDISYPSKAPERGL